MNKRKAESIGPQIAQGPEYFLKALDRLEGKCGGLRATVEKRRGQAHKLYEEFYNTPRSLVEDRHAEIEGRLHRLLDGLKEGHSNGAEESVGCWERLGTLNGDSAGADDDVIDSIKDQRLRE